MFNEEMNRISPALARYEDIEQFSQGDGGQEADLNVPPSGSVSPHPMGAAVSHPSLEHQSSFSPIRRGAEDGMSAARHSIEMSEAQKKRAMGRAIIGMFSNMGTPAVGSGLAGNLGMINKGFMPALNAYDAERAHQEEQNFLRMKFHQDQENRRAQQLQEAAAFEEGVRHHRALEGMQQIERGLRQKQYEAEARRELEDKAREKEFQAATGMRGKLMDNYSPSQANYAQKKYEKYVEKADSAYSAKEDARRINQMARDPKTKHLFNSEYFAIMNRYGEDPGMLHTMLTKVVPAKDRDALFMLNAARKNLYVNSLKGISAKALNMQLEGQLYSPIPGAQMSARAAAQLTDKIMKHADTDIEVYTTAVKAHENGFDVTIGPKSYELAKKGLLGRVEEAEKGAIDSDASVDGRSMGIVQLRGPDGRVIKAGGNITPEVILRLKDKGYELVLNE